MTSKKDYYDENFDPLSKILIRVKDKTRAMELAKTWLDEIEREPNQLSFDSIVAYWDAQEHKDRWMFIELSLLNAAKFWEMENFVRTKSWWCVFFYAVQFDPEFVAIRTPKIH